MANISYFTKEGLENLKAELATLRTQGRKEIAQQIADAREKGDLSENAEYDAAKDAQGHLELKISKLEETLSTARLLDEKSIDTSRVRVLSNVTIRNLNSNKVQTYMLVSEKEADIRAGKISVDSPIGKGLLGYKVGEISTIEAPAGIVRFEILEINI